MKKEKLRNILRRQNGITLIALVVTIIVLIILAVISINLVFNKGGIIGKAERTKEFQRAADVAEQVEIWKGDKTLAEYMHEEKQSLDSFLTELVQKGLITEAEKATIQETGSVTIGERTIVFGSDALTLVEMYEAGLSCTEENCTNSEHLHIGDYVNYQNPTSREVTVSGTDTGMQDAKTNGNNIRDDVLNQTFKVANNQVHWRVLGKDEETGGIKLIAGSPIKKETGNNDPYFYMYGAKGYQNAIDILDNRICSLYKNGYATKARSVKIEDINEITGVTSPEKIREVDLANEGTNPQGEDHKYGGIYEFANAYTPETYLANTGRGTISDTIDGYGYAINAPADKGVPFATVSSTRQYNLLFENVDWTGKTNQGRCYWLSSRGVIAHSSSARFGPGAVITVDDVTVTCSAGGLKINGTINKYAYAINASTESGVPAVTVNNTRQDNLLFENMDSKGKPYWCSSSGIVEFSYLADFTHEPVFPGDDMTAGDNTSDLFDSNGTERSVGLAVRPVVILGSDVTIDDIQKTDQTEREAIWNYTANPTTD